jgi:uncharacterized protein
LRGRSLPAFFLLTFALAVPFWLVGARGNRLGTGLLSVLPAFLPLSALQTVCPLLAALLLVQLREGAQGTWDFVRGVLDPRLQAYAWYTPALLVAPVAAALAYAVMAAQGRLVPDRPVPPPQLAALAGLYLLAAIFEEGGWTGYATDPLQARWTALPASLALGLIEVAFHMSPLIEASRTPEWTAWWSLGTVSQRVLKMWLHNASGRAVLPVAVFHASVNLGISWLPNNGDPDPAIFALILAVAAAVVTLVWGPITLATSRPDLRRRLFGRRLHRLKASKYSRKETD